MVEAVRENGKTGAYSTKISYTSIEFKAWISNYIYI